jgi:hypothetical protein
MRRLILLCAALAAAALAPPALADDNTSFETGDFSGWDVSAPSGDAQVLPGGAPGGGSHYGSVTAGSEGEYQWISVSIYLQAGDAVSAAFAFVDNDYCPYNDEGQVAVSLDGNAVATFMTGDTCASGDKPDGPSPWGEAQVYVTEDGYYTVVARVRNGGDSAASSSVWLDKVARRTPRAAYCAGTGNTAPDGSPLTAGSFLDLRLDQPSKDGHYAGATLARFVEGKGLTCDAPPAGFVQDGLAGDAQHVPSGLYAYFRQA